MMKFKNNKDYGFERISNGVYLLIEKASFDENGDNAQDVAMDALAYGRKYGKDIRYEVFGGDLILTRTDAAVEKEYQSNWKRNNPSYVRYKYGRLQVGEAISIDISEMFAYGETKEQVRGQVKDHAKYYRKTFKTKTIGNELHIKRVK